MTIYLTHEVLVKVRTFSADPFSDQKNLRQSYDPTLKATRTSSSDTRRFFISALSSLVTDGVLLIGMLLGIMRSSHGSSFGLWHLLYQQVVAYLPLQPPLIPDVFQVLHLVSLGNDCGCSTYGVWILSL
jgi:hypothetical protein